MLVVFIPPIFHQSGGLATRQSGVVAPSLAPRATAGAAGVGAGMNGPMGGKPPWRLIQACDGFPFFRLAPKRPSDESGRVQALQLVDRSELAVIAQPVPEPGAGEIRVAVRDLELALPLKTRFLLNGIYFSPLIRYL